MSGPISNGPADKNSHDINNGGSSSGRGSFLEDAALYFLVKVATSVDDLVWLSPFAAISGDDRHDERPKVFAVYLAICLLITLTATLLAFFADVGLAAALHDSSSNRAGRFLNLMGGACIALLAFNEWRNSGGEDEDEGDFTETQHRDEEDDLLLLPPTAAAEDGGEYGALGGGGGDAGEGVGEEVSADAAASPPAVIRHSRQHRRHVLVDLFGVGILGQLDTLAVFFSVVVGEGPPIRLIPIFVGSLLAAFVVIASAYFITLFRPLTRCLQKIPLWALLGAIALFVLLQGLMDS